MYKVYTVPTHRIARSARPSADTVDISDRADTSHYSNMSKVPALIEFATPRVSSKSVTPTSQDYSSVTSESVIVPHTCLPVDTSGHNVDRNAPTGEQTYTASHDTEGTIASTAKVSDSITCSSVFYVVDPPTKFLDDTVP